MLVAHFLTHKTNAMTDETEKLITFFLVLGDKHVTAHVMLPMYLKQNYLPACKWAFCNGSARCIRWLSALRCSNLIRCTLYQMADMADLYTHGCPELKSMPPELGKLTNLQTLSCFAATVTGPDCNDVAELQHLNLGGQLELYQVENVKEAEAKVANLGNKKDLSELPLRWTSVSVSKVLNNFEPHGGLQVLKIYSYGGKCMGMLQNMVEIHLFHCERLQVLFRCGTSFTFPKLKGLKLVGLLDFERWWEINERREEQIIFPLLEKLFIMNCGKLIALPEAPLLHEPCVEGGYRLVRSAFPALKVLELEDLESFQKWDAVEETQGEQILFPQLEKLSVKYCSKLIDLPKAPLLQEPCSEGGYRLVRSAFPALKVLTMENLESFQRWNAVEETLFPQLEKLSIQKCPKLIDLPEAPKLNVFEIEDGKQEIFHWVDKYLSSLTNLILKLENIGTPLEAECTLIVPVDIKVKWNQKSPLTVMKLGCCNSFFGSGTLEPWDYFVHLEELEIDRCDVLVHWPENVFQCLVSLRRLIIRYCKNLTGYAQAPLEPSSSERSQHLQALEFLELENCASLVEMFNVPASLKRIDIERCRKLESIFGKQQGISESVEGSSCSEAITPTAVSELYQADHFCPCLEHLRLDRCGGSLSAVLDLPPSLKTILIVHCSSIQVITCQLGGLQRPEVTTSINVPQPSAAVAAAREHSLPPRLQSLKIWWCSGMLGGILRLPTSLKELSIDSNSRLTSLESVLREHPPSLERLCLENCSTLASLPNDPQAYGSLQRLEIKGCPAMKKLPRCLQQQLGSIEYKRLDACYEVMAFKPKTWKEIPRIVREWRKAAQETRESAARAAQETRGSAIRYML